jgi:hypothetical protein
MLERPLGVGRLSDSAPNTRGVGPLSEPGCCANMERRESLRGAFACIQTYSLRLPSCAPEHSSATSCIRCARTAPDAEVQVQRERESKALRSIPCDL